MPTRRALSRASTEYWTGFHPRLHDTKPTTTLKSETSKIEPTTGHKEGPVTGKVAVEAHLDSQTQSSAIFILSPDPWASSDTFPSKSPRGARHSRVRPLIPQLTIERVDFESHTPTSGQSWHIGGGPSLGSWRHYLRTASVCFASGWLSLWQVQQWPCP